MQLTNIQLLIAVNFLHSLCTGIIVPMLPPHLFQLGASYTIMGFLVAGMHICQSLSKDFLALFEHGKKFILTFCLFVSFLCQLMVGITDSYKVIILARIIFTLVDEVENCCKDYIVKIQPEENHIKFFNMIEISKPAGIAIGAILGGYITDFTDDFEMNGLAASVMTITAILLVQNLDQDSLDLTVKSDIKQLPEKCYNQLLSLIEVDYVKHWDVIILKIFYFISFLTFFNKYTMLIRYNYEAGPIVIGYTVAYQNMLLFACSCFTPFLTLALSKFAKEDIFDHCLLVCSTTLAALYYAPTYDCYLIVIIPMLITYTMVNRYLEEDALHLDKEESLGQASDTLNYIMNVVTPVLFGVLCEFFGGGAFKLLAILAPVASLFVLNRRFLRPKKEEHKEEGLKEE